jgi:hypothetical protein
MGATKRVVAKKPVAIGPGEALDILSSALRYCQQAGLVVQAGNANGGVTIILEGIITNGGRLEVAAAAAEP